MKGCCRSKMRHMSTTTNGPSSAFLSIISFHFIYFILRLCLMAEENEKKKRHSSFKGRTLQLQEGIQVTDYKGKK